MKQVKSWVFVIVLCWTQMTMAAGAEDPNSSTRSVGLRREIMQSQIQPLYLSITSVAHTDLNDLISTLNNLEVPASDPPARTDASTAVQEESPAVDAEGPSTAVSQTPEITEAEPVEPKTEIVEPEWLRRIDAMDNPVDPMLLGDVLFHSGQTERAERFYRRALEKLTSPDNPDWQWAIYQRANCLRWKHPEQAGRLYEELVQKAPNSAWAGAAQARQAVVDWQRSDQAGKAKRFLSDPNDLL